MRLATKNVAKVQEFTITRAYPLAMESKLKPYKLCNAHESHRKIVLSKPFVIMIATILSISGQKIKAHEVDQWLDISAQVKLMGIPGCAIAVVRNGKVIAEHVYGFADAKHKVPVTPNTTFQLASVTKVFTAIALMQLEKAGRIKLNDPVSKYISGLPAAWRGATLGELATHTSGLPDVIADSSKPLTQLELTRTESEALQYAENKSISSPPGSSFAYDQTNFLLIKEVIEKVSGDEFRHFVSIILSRIGMQRTVWGDSRISMDDRAVMYTSLHSQTIHQDATLFEYPPYLDAAAGLNSSIADMESFAKAITSNTLLPIEELDLMWQPASDRKGHTIDISKAYGIIGTVAPTIGWFYADNSHGRFPRIFMTGGSSSVVIVYPSQKLCVVILTNLQARDDPLPLAEKVANRYILGLKPIFD